MGISNLICIAIDNMNHFKYSVIGFVLSCLAAVALGLTQSDVDLVIRKSRSALTSSKPAMVRLTFHDCVGGCDGCLNVNNPDNAGLENLVADLEAIYQAEGFNETISRADMWALLGIWSVQETIDRNNEECSTFGPNGTEAAPNSNYFYENCEIVPDLTTTFRWGRQDCATAPHTDVDVHLPAATLGYDGLMTFFSDEFGFTPRQVTALMGAHTLGSADIFNSGFQGSWINNEQNFFNNHYYTHMVNSSLDWKLLTKDCASLTNIDTTQCSANQTTGWQWQVPGTAFNINADMALYKEFSVDSEGKPSCEYADCPLSASANFAESFSDDNDAWIQTFSNVYFQMLKNGYTTLQSLDD